MLNHDATLSLLYASVVLGCGVLLAALWLVEAARRQPSRHYRRGAGRPFPRFVCAHCRAIARCKARYCHACGNAIGVMSCGEVSHALAA